MEVMSGLLDGVNVALGVTGSIAAVKTVELAHELRRHGATVRGIMTDAAEGIIHPWALEFATEQSPVTEVTGRVEHVALCGNDGWADVLLVAPATANTVGKIAAAIDDTTVTTCATTALGADLPIVMAPAMHEPMYDHPGVLDALDQLEAWGVEFAAPRLEEGKAKIASLETIVTMTARATGSTPLAGQKVVVTAGATAERIDPVRVLTNRASGKTGRAVARGCYVRGADVTVVHGSTGTEPELAWADVVEVESAAEMTEATLTACDGADALVSAAAIGDYTTASSTEKIRSGKETLTLELEPTRKLIDAVRDAYPELTIVGFKAETSGDDGRMIERARELSERVGLAFAVANDSSVMGADRTRALLVHPATDVEEFTGTKLALGLRIADDLDAALRGRSTG